MKNILVSGSSGIVGYGILRSLRLTEEKFNLIGTTIYSDSVAQGFCDVFELAVPTDDPQYISWLIDIINKHKIDLLIPGIEADMYMWASHVEEIERTGAKVLLNNLSLLEFCKDKWTFYLSLKKHNSVHVIESSLSADFDELKDQFELPFLMKPKRGFGSKGIVRVFSQEIFDQHKHNCGTILMTQPLIGNDEEEFTTSAFCDGKGGYFCHMTLRRKLSKDGFTDKAEVVVLEEMDGVLNELCQIYKPIGPTNFQFRLHNGVFKLLEINPRISSSTSIRSAFGYNESIMAVKYFLDNQTPVQPIIKQGNAVRYIDEVIFYK